MTSGNVLDLSKRGNMSPHYTRELNQVADEIRQEYVSCINGLSEACKDNLLDWFVTPFACRNTYVCSVFEDVVKAVFVRSVIDRGDSVDVIIVDTPVVAEMIGAYIDNSVQIISKQTFLKYYLFLSYSVFIGLFKYISSALLRYLSFNLAALVSTGKAHVVCNESVTVLETFIYKNSFKGGVLQDRHFNNIQVHLDATQLNKLLYIPTLYKVHNSFSLFLKAIKSKTNFLFVEEYISVLDILYPLRHMFFLNYKHENVNIRNFDISKLVNHSLLRHSTHTSSLYALLKFRFCNNLKKDSAIRISHIVKWYENQEVDHGSIMGWRSYSASLNIIGYMGFFSSKNYLCAYPMPIEHELRVTPDSIGVMGSGLIKQHSIFCDALSFKVVPSFRFSKPNIKGGSNATDMDEIRIFVPLPISEQHVNQILKVITDTSLRSCENSISFIIKPHPAAVFSLSGFPDNNGKVRYCVVNDSLSAIFDRVDFVLSAASSTVVEAIMHGVAVLLLSSTQSLRENVIPDFVPKSLWDEIYCASELCGVISQYGQREKLSTPQLNSLNATLIELPPNKENISNLLGFLD
tara:strand:- start:7727 stop:9454 length:1728 start_codon:yes stop_codon:yes gene_type:complete